MTCLNLNLAMSKQLKISLLTVLILLSFSSVVVQECSATFYWKLDVIESKNPAGGGGSSNSIAIDSMDRPHAAYDLGFGGTDVRYARWTGSQWNIESFDSNARRHPSLKLDSMDRPHIAYQDLDWHLRYAHRTGISWEIEIVDSDSDTGVSPSLAIDSSNHPHISYYNRRSDYDLKYAHWDGINWQIQTVDSFGEVGGTPSIALDSLERPHIVYVDIDNYRLKYARWIGSVWVIDNLTSFGIAFYPSLALDSLDRPHISYLNASHPWFLKYAKWTGTSWDIETITDHGNRANTPHLALDSLNRPHITYANMSDLGHGISYSRWTGTMWETQMVNAGGGLDGPSLALDSVDRPHICFYGGGPGPGDVWYARTTLTPLPDPYVSMLDLSFYPPSPVSKGTTVMVNATIHNIGYSDASNVLVRFYDVTPPLSQIGDDIIIGLIPVGGQNHTQVQWSTSSLGLRNVCVFLDPLDSIEEVNEMNNEACISMFVYGLADIAAKEFTSDPPSPVSFGTSVTLNATFSNDGEDDAANFEVAFFEDSNHDRIIQGGEALYEETVLTLAVGESTFIYHSFTALFEGIHDICVWADPPPGVVEEGNETDNLLCMEFVVLSPIYPRPPSNLQAKLDGDGLSDVLLSWGLSPDDGNASNPVVRYDILRGTSYVGDGISYTSHDSVPNATSEYVDTGAGEGNLDDYFYVVCAINLAGNSSCSASQAGKFTRPLSRGPNLVSIPLMQSDEAIDTILQTVRFDKAWSHDSSSQEWKWHMTFKDYRRGLWSMNQTTGLWVNVTRICNLTVAGIVPPQTTIHLHEGWNLVSFPSFNSSYTVYDLKMDTGALRVEGYDLAPPNFLGVLGDAEVLQAGFGYWVRVEAAVDWIVEVS